MKKNSYFVLILLVALVTSCSAPKNVAYLQNSDYVDLSSEYLYDAKIMPKDILTITVNTVSSDLAPWPWVGVHPRSRRGKRQWQSRAVEGNR